MKLKKTEKTGGLWRRSRLSSGHYEAVWISRVDKSRVKRLPVWQTNGLKGMTLNWNETEQNKEN